MGKGGTSAPGWFCFVVCALALIRPAQWCGGIINRRARPVLIEFSVMPKQIHRAVVNSMYKVIVAGGRDFTDTDLLKHTLDKLFSQRDDIEVVTGMARGADTLALKYAKDNKYQVARFPAKWKVHGNSAGFERNKVMARYADACVCFWDGKSKGTAHMILMARHYGLNLRIIKY
jgi:hypothetical protein